MADHCHLLNCVPRKNNGVGEPAPYQEWPCIPMAYHLPSPCCLSSIWKKHECIKKVKIKLILWALGVFMIPMPWQSSTGDSMWLCRSHRPTPVITIIERCCGKDKEGEEQPNRFIHFQLFVIICMFVCDWSLEFLMTNQWQTNNSGSNAWWSINNNWIFLCFYFYFWKY